MASQSSARGYPVFISHAGEDKATIASPLRKLLGELGIPAFVDENDIRPGGNATDEITSAMESADIAVIVLSPEFVAKKWPMKELLFFLNHRKNCQANGRSVPAIIPVFYRLSVKDMYGEPRLERKDADGKSLYRKTRFFERCDNDEPEADINIIRSALKALHSAMGVENKYHASNEVSSLPSRLLLLKDICAKISQVMTEAREKFRGRNEDPSIKSSNATKFRPHFHCEPLYDILLDFESTDPDGKPVTLEGNIKNRILNRQSDSEPIFAIHGIGGVGKSTILKALANDGDLRSKFGDGIYLMSLGMDATVGTLIRELCQMLLDSGAVNINERSSMNTKEIREAMQFVVSWIRGKRCAFLIDDVWTSKISGQLFSQVFKRLEGAGPDIVIIFTTRERDIASFAPIGNMFHLIPREVQGSDSMRIIFNHAGITENSVDDCTKPIIREVLGICSGLPVSLAAAGKSVKMLRIDMTAHYAWEEYLTMIRNYRERLLQQNVAGYGNLYITFGASLSLLEEGKRERLGFKTPASFGEMHRRLCVLEKQASMPASALQNLWELQSEVEAKIVGSLFAQVGLAECRYGYYGVNIWYLSMHDSLHDYANAEATRHEGVARAHEVLLDRYCLPCVDLQSGEQGQTNWSILKNDGYILYNLCRHLREAGRAREIGSLVSFIKPAGQNRLSNLKEHLVFRQQRNLFAAEHCRAIATLYTQALEIQITNLEEECRSLTARQWEELKEMEQLKQVIKHFETRQLKRQKKM